MTIKLKVTTYKYSYTNFFIYLSAGYFIFGGIFLIYKEPTPKRIFFFCLIYILIVSREFITERISEIRIDPQNNLIQLVSKRFLFITNTYRHPLKNINTAFYKKIGAKGIKIDMFKLQVDGKAYNFKVDTGFSEEKLKSLEIELNAIKKQTDGDHIRNI